MAISDPNQIDKHLTYELYNQRGWLMGLGAVMLALGIIGLAMLFGFTIASVIYFGALLVLGGIAVAVDAFRNRQRRDVMWRSIVAILYIAAGIVIFVDPVAASATLTLVLAAILVAIGVTRIILAFNLRQHGAWGWMLVSGILSAVLGFMIIVGWPQASAWVIGLFVALELIFFGLASIMSAALVKPIVEESERGMERRPA